MTIRRLIWAEALMEVRTLREPAAERALNGAGLAFVLLAALFMTTIMLAASMAPGYDIARGAISDLGVVPATSALFNGSLLVTGLLNILGGGLLFRAWGGPATLLLHLMAGAGAIGAGLVTLATPGVHGIFALLAFVFYNLQAIGVALRFEGPLRWIGLGLGVLGLAFTFVMFVGDTGHPAWFGPIGHGGTERMIVYPPMLWLLVLGGALLGTRDRSRV